VDGASDGRTDEAAPVLRLWLALYAEYGRMGYDG